MMTYHRGFKNVLSICTSSASRRVINRFDSSGPRLSLSNVHQTIAGRQRFYKTVDVVPVLDTNGIPTDEYKILLDNRTLRTPAGNNLHFPNIGLALTIAAEWDAQKAGNSKGIQPATMPMMTLAATAIDQILPNGYQVKKTCLSYLPTDTALFLTAESDRILLRKQRQHFQPILRLTIVAITSRLFCLDILNDMLSSDMMQRYHFDQLQHYLLYDLHCLL
jgi:chaperone required for assembly of F1-ATPase